jgi:hypothetical protein
MERYVVISTFNDQRTTNTVCAGLESRGIPVMIEHVHVRGGSLLGVAFRVLVPLESSQAALKILAGLGITQWSENVALDSNSESASAA